jgi:hypothetical protein
MAPGAHSGGRDEPLRPEDQLPPEASEPWPHNQKKQSSHLQGYTRDCRQERPRTCGLTVMNAKPSADGLSSDHTQAVCGISLDA